MPLNDNITLAGDLNNYRLDGDDMHAMNELYDRIARQGANFIGGLDGDAMIGTESSLRHWTSKIYGWTVFFRAGNGSGPWTMTVYAHGKHSGDDLKQYSLFTYLNGKKAKLYSF